MTSTVLASGAKWGQRTTISVRAIAALPPREADVVALLERLFAMWRSIWTPQSVRDVEEVGLQEAVDALPMPPERDPAEERQLRQVQERLDRIEHRNRELARLYRREGEE